MVFLLTIKSLGEFMDSSSECFKSDVTVGEIIHDYDELDRYQRL